MALDALAKLVCYRANPFGKSSQIDEQITPETDQGDLGRCQNEHHGQKDEIH